MPCVGALLATDQPPVQEARHHMTKRLVSAAASLAAIGAAALATAPSAMAYNGGSCVLQGDAVFSTPLTAGPQAQPFSYTFTGSLSNCESGGSASGLNSVPTGGSISTPAPVSGSGSCFSSTTGPGIAVVSWNDGKTTVEQYSTTGYLAAVVVQGTVVASATVNNNGTTSTYTTDEPSTPVGDSTYGELTFAPDQGPTACNSGGVSSATIRGLVQTGGSA